MSELFIKRVYLYDSEESRKNTIAILFPYVRSYISIITTQPGMTPIVLPAMNIVAMINDQKK